MFGVIHMNGSGDNDPPLDSLSSLYDELVDADSEHGDVAVVHDESRWCISAHRDGRAVFERLGDRGKSARHMAHVTKERIINLWNRLIHGDIDSILGEPWKEGYNEELK